MTKLNACKLAFAVLALCVATTIVSSAQTFTTLVSFDGSGPVQPMASLIQGTDGNLWGTAVGSNTIFAITPAGAGGGGFSFCNNGTCSGVEPMAPLVQATNGNFYGTTQLGPQNYGQTYGTVFEFDPMQNRLTTLYTFCAQGNCADGQYPDGLIQANNGNFYGATQAGGSSTCSPAFPVGCGTLFRITPKGTLTVLYNFCSQPNCTDGALPSQVGLVQATNGSFYGTTSAGGDPTCNAPYGCGTVFKITPTGKLTTLHSFNGTDGNAPVGPLIQATNGAFYGVTVGGGGAYGFGTVFEITPTGTLKTLHSFSGSPIEGAFPYAGVIEGTDGNFYGTTSGGGPNNCDPPYPEGCGTLFEVTPAGVLTTLYNFCSQPNCTDGDYPYGGLLQATNGNFYGTTGNGGDLGCNVGLRIYGCGTVFSLNMGRGPFVSFVRGSGIIGQYVGILGQGFTGTTSVSFNGTPASFKVVSATFLTATVPSGATTGFVTVTTPSGTLTSNKKFRVTQ